MCGIVGILGSKAIADDMVDALRRLEYRGYDSAGIATLEAGRLARRRAEGKLRNLEIRLSEEPLKGAIGIGHTRWATHGKPNERNAHPHATDRLAVVHNGIIENFRDLRQELEAEGIVFQTETDTEVIAQLVSREMGRGLSPDSAVSVVLPRLRGAFALAFLFDGQDDLLIGARKGSPLAVGYGDGEMYLGSDALALAPFTNRLAYLEEGDRVVLTRMSATYFDESGKRVERAVQVISASAALVDKGNHRHFMAKEIYEQPEVVGHTLSAYLDMVDGRVRLPAMPFDFSTIERVTIAACGTAYLAGLTAKYWFERYARIPVEIDVASEFRYREAPLPKNGLMIVVSQSGETADTLASLRYAKEQGQKILCVVNVATSTIARESHVVMQTIAGPEIGVASTKAFTCQLAALACLVIGAGRARGTIDEAEERRLVDALMSVPGLMNEALKREEQIHQLARDHLAKASDVLFLGRGTSYPLALEGALKLKELSYIHAEGYAAGELKHGPIALIDETMPVIVVAPKDALMEKTVSNMQEVAARGGRIVLLADAGTAHEAGINPVAEIDMPSVDPFVAPLVYALPVQQIAYFSALVMGKDIDQPRNLAKSVTVE